MVPPYTFQVDKKAPTITITTPIATSYPSGAIVNASFMCTDGGSGVASCAGTVPSGSPISTTPGTHTFTVNATDKVANTATKSVTYTVYGVCLQYNPSNLKPVNGTMPIKVQLCDAAGHNLSSASITLTATTVDGSIDPGPDFNGSTNLGHLFRFDPQSAMYIYNLNVGALRTGSHILYFFASTTGNVQPYLQAPFMLK
jgi:hypothetical protein